MDLFDRDDVFLARWLAGELSEAEEQAFQAHPDYDKFQDLAKASSILQVPKTDQDQHWKNIKASHQKRQNPSSQKPLPNYRRLIMAAAAIALLLVSFFFLFPPSMQEVRTAFGEQKTHQLPDQSVVRLNAQSSIQYDQSNFSAKRLIDLEGEAFFEVRPGASFIVNTSQGQVKVLGTSFTVRSRSDDFQVACQSGRVEVGDQLNNRVQLSSGESIRIIDRRLQPKESIAVEEVGSWQRGISRFYSEPLKNVVTALENQFDVKINLTAKQDEKFSGSFLHKDVDTAFKMVFDPMGLKYKQQADRSYMVEER